MLTAEFMPTQADTCCVPNIERHNIIAITFFIAFSLSLLPPVYFIDIRSYLYHGKKLMSILLVTKNGTKDPSVIFDENDSSPSSGEPMPLRDIQLYLLQRYFIAR